MFIFIVKIISSFIFGGFVALVVSFLFNQKSGRKGCLAELVESSVKLVGCLIVSILGIIGLYKCGKLFGAYTFVMLFGFLFTIAIFSMFGSDEFE